LMRFFSSSLITVLLISAVLAEVRRFYLCHADNTNQVDYKWLAKQPLPGQMGVPDCIQRPDAFNYMGMVNCLDNAAASSTGSPNSCIVKAVFDKGSARVKLEERYCYTANLDVFNECLIQTEGYSGVYVCAVDPLLRSLRHLFRLNEGDSLPMSKECRRMRKLDGVFDIIDDCVKDTTDSDEPGLAACIFDVEVGVIQRASCQHTDIVHFRETCYQPFSIVAPEFVTKMFACHENGHNLVDFEAIGKYKPNDLFNRVHRSGCDDMTQDDRYDLSAMADCMNRHPVVGAKRSNNCIIQLFGDPDGEIEVVKEIQCFNIEKSYAERCYLDTKRTSGVFAYMTSASDKPVEQNDVFHFPEGYRWINPGVQTYESILGCLDKIGAMNDQTKAVVVEIKNNIVLRTAENSVFPDDLVKCANELTTNKGLQANST